MFLLLSGNVGTGECARRRAVTRDCRMDSAESERLTRLPGLGTISPTTLSRSTLHFACRQQRPLALRIGSGVGITLLPSGERRNSGGRKTSMSAIKNPEAKKQVSLERDRRNTYGENSQSSCKNVKLGKQRRHMDERRTVGEVLGRLRGCVQEDQATDAELLAKTRIIDGRRRGFKKKPDTPPGIVLANKKARKNPT